VKTTDVDDPDTWIIAPIQASNSSQDLLDTDVRFGSLAQFRDVRAMSALPLKDISADMI
jgi:hypothetical protein